MAILTRSLHKLQAAELTFCLWCNRRSTLTLRLLSAISRLGDGIIWLVFSLSPLASLWFEHVANLPPDLMHPALLGLVIAAPQPAMRVLQSWYQGLLVAAHRTRPITESVVVFSVACGAVLLAGVLWQGVPGIYVAALGYSLGRVAQTAWLWWRCRRVSD